MVLSGRVNTYGIGKNPYAGDKSGTLCLSIRLWSEHLERLFSLFGRYIFLGLVTLIYWGSIDVVKYHLETIYVLFSFLIEFTDSEAFGLSFRSWACFVCRVLGYSFCSPSHLKCIQPSND